MPSFKSPSDDDPYFKRFFMIFYMVLEALVEVGLPILAAVVFFAFIVFLCGHALGIVPVPPDNTTDRPTPKEKQADSPGLLQAEMTDEETLRKKQTDPAGLQQAVDEKTLLKVEMEILKEMQQIRQAKLNRLVESD